VKGGVADFFELNRDVAALAVKNTNVGGSCSAV
jgi:hypothetical protein